MTLQRNDLRVIDPLLTATKRGFGFEIEEPVKRRDHSMVNIVFLPTLMVGSLVYMAVFGALLSVYSAGYIWLGWRENRALLIVFGLPWVPACRFSFQRLTAQLDTWKDLQYRKLRAHVDDDTSTSEPYVDKIERVDPGHLIGLRASWNSGWQAELAKRVYNQHGRWIGGDSVVRDRHLKGLVRDLNNQFKDGGKVKTDLIRLGWIDENNLWQDKAREELRKRVFFASPTLGAGQ